MHDNVIPFPTNDNSGGVDDDELVRDANSAIAQWKAAGTPSLTEVQELLHECICAGASPMARDRIVAAIIAAFDTEVGSKRALNGTWSKLAKDLQPSARRTHVTLSFCRN